MTITTETSQEPIPGYRILERIGAGGYGEVWKAEAPGGLVKALKFVYGRLEEDRAARELKSLERIKDVRHPFLLSLERIEIADGRLIIVTELAEGSLKDRFDQCKKEGRCGIDREELLTYMRDAADVLDYMLEQHSLQHLDIKPENLLLVGGRIKVADFGLVKKLQDVTASLLGGLTPLYAPPELFEGAPSARSDQYSLAIVYVEMLTGTLPFSGRTAGQLAKQHLHAAPKLGSLPPAEQAVVRQALAKRPEDRFASCREFIEALVEAPRREVDSGRDAPRRGGAPGSAATVSRSSAPRRAASSREVSQTGIGAPRRRVPRVSERPCRDGGPVEVLEEAMTLEPTVWVGIGGTGCRVVRRLQEALEDHLPVSLNEVPAWQFLWVDSDVQDLVRTTASAEAPHAAMDPTLPIPLKRTQDYKARASSTMSWLSRRWLYHIPKVPATNGLRPLGCLAFVDHRETFVERLTALWHHVCSEEARQRSAEATGWTSSSSSGRVVLVVGLGGGTGGGALVEAARAAREVIVASGHEGVCSAVLLHATPRSPQDRELALVSSYATIVEIHHAQERAGDDPLFQDIDLCYLGDQLGETAYEAAMDRVAEELALESATSVSLLRKKIASRKRSTASVGSHCLRVHGHVVIGARRGPWLDRAVRELAGALVEHWLTGEWPLPEKDVSIRERVTCTSAPLTSTRCRTSGLDEVREHLVGFLEELNLDAEAALAYVDTWCETALTEPVADFLVREVQRLQPETHGEQAFGEWVRQVEGLLERLLGSEEATGPSALSQDPGVLEPVLLKREREYVETHLAPITRRMVGMASDPEYCVAGADVVLREFRKVLRKSADALREKLRELERQWEALRAEIARLCEQMAGKNARSKTKDGEGGSASAHLQQCVLLRWERFRFRRALSLFAEVDRSLAAALDELVNVSRELRVIHDLVASTDEGGFPDVASDEYAMAVQRSLQERKIELLEELDRAVAGSIQKEFPDATWVDLLQDGCAGRELLPDWLLQEASRLVMHVTSECDVVAHAAPADRDALAERLSQWYEEAGAAAEAWGGVRYRYLMVPDPGRIRAWLDAYYASEQSLPTVLKGRPAEVVLGVEVDGVSLTRAAVQLIEARADRVEYAYRLVTRSDIEYPALPDDREST